MSERSWYVQLPYPYSVTSDVAAADADSVIVQNVAVEGASTFMSEVGQLVGTKVPLLVGSILTPMSGFTATVSMPAWAAGSPYAGGMTDPAYRWRLLSEQKRLWQLYVDTYGSPSGFYISHEANLGLWGGYSWSEAVRAGYEAFLIQSLRDAHEIVPYATVVWSPSIWANWSDLSSSFKNLLTQAASRTFSNVRGWLRSNDLFVPSFIVELQDGVGAGALRGKTRDDAVDAFEGLACDQMNVEAFTQTSSGLVPASDWADRVAYYESKGIPIGTNFELRYRT